MRPHLALALLAVVLVAPPADAQSDTALGRRFDSLVVAHLVDGPGAGVTAAVVRGQDTLLLKAYGEADRERHQPVAVGTVYRVGSIAKQFTAAAIMQLVERGQLSLSDTLGRFLPEYPRWGALTIRQLLSHTAGLHELVTPREWIERYAADTLVDTRLATIRDLPLEFVPGTRWRYSNPGYLLLAKVLERATGQPYHALMRDRFFTPLGMRSARECRTGADGPDAVGYIMSGAGLTPATILVLGTAGAGSLCMNVRDFLRWQTALTGGRIVSPATYRRMATSDTLADGTPTGYGFGLAPGRMAGHGYVKHNGTVGGFYGEQLWFPRDSLRVVVFTNATAGDPGRLARNLAAATLGLPLEQRAPVAAVPLTADEMTKYEGVYLMQSSNGNTIAFRVRAEGDHLVAQANAGAPFALVYLGDDTFGTTIDMRWRLVMRIENGRAVYATRRSADGTAEGPRQP